MTKPLMSVVAFASLFALSIPVGAQSPALFPPPIVQAGTVKLSAHAYVIPDGGVRLVPNVGIVVGTAATLVVDTGMGNGNARTVLAEVAKISRNTQIYLVTTHAHAEHTSGMGAFPADTTFVVARAQQDEIDASGERAFAGMAKLSPAIAEMLQGAALRKPGIVFEQEHVLDLGGVKVRIMWMGPAHSKGDTVTLVEGEGVVFAGDIAPRQRFPSLYGDAKRLEFVKAMGRVEALHGTVIVPSHGPYGDNSVFAEQRMMLDALAARVATLKGQGQPLEAVTKTLTAEFHGRYPTWASTIPNEVEPIIRGIYTE